MEAESDEDEERREGAEDAEVPEVSTAEGSSRPTSATSDSAFPFASSFLSRNSARSANLAGGSSMQIFVKTVNGDSNYLLL